VEYRGVLFANSAITRGDAQGGEVLLQLDHLQPAVELCLSTASQLDGHGAEKNRSGWLVMGDYISMDWFFLGKIETGNHGFYH